MPLNYESLVDATIIAVINKLPDLNSTKLSPEYNYNSLPLCVIDAVFSIGVRYGTVRNVVNAWCMSQNPEWVKYWDNNAASYSMSDFIKILVDVPHKERSKRFFGGNIQRTSTKKGILKTDAVLCYARCLQNAGIEDFCAMRDPEKALKAREETKKVPGHRSGISFDYLQMLSGDDNYVKADRMIKRFIAEAAQVDYATIDVVTTQNTIKGASAKLSEKYEHVTPRLLDHTIWTYQRNQHRQHRITAKKRGMVGQN